MLAAADFDNPLLWAVLIGWILSVVLHEFAHGIVAYWGGDYTIKERGGLTLNPLQYIDPVMSIILPAVFLLMGGIPLPGGVTYIRHDLLRHAWWETAVSAAGPTTNFLLFLLLSLPFHPVVGWLDVPTGLVEEWSNGAIFLAAMAQLQMLAVVLNLIPIPPLDGFGIISPWLPEHLRIKLTTPPISTISFLLIFALIIGGGLLSKIVLLTLWLWLAMGFELEQVRFFYQSFNLALFGGAP